MKTLPVSGQQLRATIGCCSRDHIAGKQRRTSDEDMMMYHSAYEHAFCILLGF